MALESGTQLGHYEITEQIGKGGMGEVYRARDTKLGREVAIKTLPSEFADDPDRLARFEREAKLLASLNHPNIAAIYGLEEHEGSRFLVLELVEGDTLADRLKRGAIPVEESLKLALQIAEALEAAHEKGVIHRDLKPANIKITPDGKAKVLDFGLAKAFIGDQADVNLSNSPTLSIAATQAGVVLGTAAYMSPEQAGGETADTRTDVWSFGVVLFEMLTGRQLFTGRNVTHILADVVRSEPRWSDLPLNLNPRLRLLLERCLEKEPKDRLTGISDARVNIQRVLADPSGAIVEPAAEVVQVTPQSRLPWIAAIVLAVVGASFAAWTLKPEPTLARPVTRHDFELPEGIAFRNVFRNSVAVSPDGNYYVYNGTGGLYLRPLNELNARLIAGTQDDVVGPFFSHDSQWVGFWHRDGRIEKVAVSGGTPVLIGPVPNNPFGISWGPDDIVVFAQRDGIYTVSANGGTPERIIEAGAGEEFSGPTILPDGRGILFTARSGQDAWDNGQIVVASLDAPHERTPVWNGSAARYSPTGHLIYALGSDLFAIAFDLDTLSTIGTAVSLVQGLSRAASDSANYDISDEGSLVYILGAGGSSVLRSLVWVELDGTETLVGAPTDQYEELALSPDGSRVALSVDDGTQEDIWIWDFARRTPSRLTFDEADDNTPVWTADSEWVIFRSQRGGSDNIYRKRADGTGIVEQLTSGEGTKWPRSLSPDGQTLAFEQVTQGPDDILMLDLGSAGDPNNITEPVMWLQTAYAEWNPQISPDGRWVAYQSNESGTFEVYVRPFVDPRTGGQWQVSTAGGVFPLWSPDGRWLYYGNQQQMMRVAIDTDTTFEHGSPEALFDYPVVGAGIAPDGDRFLLLKDAATTTEGNAFRPQIITVLNWTEELKERVPVP